MSTSDNHRRHSATHAVTAGRRKDWTHGIVNPPVYRASTCTFDTYGEMQDRLKDKTGHKLFYGRKGTPTHWAFEEALQEMEGGTECKVFPSGVAAVTGAILSVVKSGDHVLITDSVYDPTRSFADGMLATLGVETSYYDPQIGDGIRDLIRPNTRALFTESPGSLTFEVQDMPALVKAARDHDLFVLCDNTWATPLFFRPLEHGVDLSIQACTKYIGGHSDVMLGAVVANDRTAPRLRSLVRALGQTASPDDVYLATRGLRTLPVRMAQHQKNALAVAHWLNGHPMVDRVLHPALEGCPGHDLFLRDFDGASGLFSIVLTGGDYPDTAAMVDEMTLFKMGFSWGGYESLIMPSDPARCRSVTPWQAPGPVLRLHIGLEEPEDLIAELDQGLERYKAHLDRKG
ncbi:cystathionine beta-lyase [Yunchengibacter salinarum]|uniref:cystathionine beta-lyase n=1 Tax=Yunchengibacter salinarum TaxID=3133399 RepID=UPI0035B5FF5B